MPISRGAWKVSSFCLTKARQVFGKTDQLHEFVSYTLKVSPKVLSLPNISLHTRNMTLADKMKNMSLSLEEEVAKCRAAVKEQGDLVKSMKSSNAPKADVDLAVKELKARKRTLEQKELQLDPPEKFDRGKLEDLLKRRFFYAPAFEIYGGVAGLYDFGPMGCAMEKNLVDIWRRHFVLEEQLLEVRCSQLTPHQVLKASGHVDRFSDVMVRDVKTGDCYRADHLLEGHLEKLLLNKKLEQSKKEEMEKVLAQMDNFKKDDLWALIQKYEAKAPGTNNDLHDPQDFNLMFGTSIGPGGLLAGFMRPETAQGIFLNFKRLLEYNNGRLPFGGAQIGCGFRNEISPRSGLLRVREFLMAEIEYFVEPDKKEMSKFKNVANKVCTLYSKEKLVAMVDLPQPISVDAVEVVLNKPAVGKGLKKNAKAVTEYVEKMTPDEVEKMEAELSQSGSYTLSIDCQDVSLQKDMVKEVRRYKKDVHVKEVEPHVIEPSFGIGRIMYAVLEHNFKVREEDEQRTWLSLPAQMAPVKCSVLPLSKNEAFEPFVSKISSALTELDIEHKVDDSSGSIGRRYARTDEIAIPYGITVDFDTINKQPQTVTLRERNSTKQVRVEMDLIPSLVSELVKGKQSWQNVVEKYGLFEGQDTISK